MAGIGKILGTSTLMLGFAMLGLAADPQDPKKKGDSQGIPPFLAELMKGSADEVEKVVNQILERMDSNKDGKISRDEARGLIAMNFDELDLNKDGFLDRAELRKEAERRLADRARPNNPPRPNPQNRPPVAVANEPDFDALDLNADGRLTREELKNTPYASKFDEIDTNKDGKIDRKEFAAYFRKEAEKKAQAEKQKEEEKKKEPEKK